MTSPASAPSIVKPRIRSSGPMTAFMKPSVCPVVRVRSTAAIGSLATRTASPRARASVSVDPTRASGGSVNRQGGISRPAGERAMAVRIRPETAMKPSASQ